MRRPDVSILGSLGVAALLVLQAGMAALVSTPPTIFIDDSRDGAQCPGALGIDGAHNVTITAMVDQILNPIR